MYRPFIEQALTEATSIALAMFGKVSSTTKQDDNNQVLTEADTTIGNLLVSLVEERYPSHNIIDEEAGCFDKGSNFTWVIDPIDGTSNFASAVPMYGTMIGLLKGSEPIAGGVSLPSLGELYVAEKSQGATCNGKQISVSSQNDLLNTLIAYGIDGHQEDPSLTINESQVIAQLVLQIRNLRTSNSTVDMMYVASGRYGGYVNKTSKIWDNVAPHIITEEAGGIYTDYSGSPIDYTDPLSKANDNFTCCSAPPQLHKKIQTILNA